MRMGVFDKSMRALVAWRGGLFLTEGKIGVLSVFSLFFRRGWECMCACVCVYAHTHTHTAQMGYLDVSPGVGMRHLEGPKNADGLNLGIHIFVYVYKVHMCIYVLRGGMRSWTNWLFPFNMSFLLRKIEDVTTISKPQSLTSVRIKDCTLRVKTKLYIISFWAIIKAIFTSQEHTSSKQKRTLLTKYDCIKQKIKE